jgi:hypothetical protein
MSTIETKDVIWQNACLLSYKTQKCKATNAQTDQQNLHSVKALSKLNIRTARTLLKSVATSNQFSNHLVAVNVSLVPRKDHTQAKQTDNAWNKGIFLEEGYKSALPLQYRATRWILWLLEEGYKLALPLQYRATRWILWLVVMRNINWIRRQYQIQFEVIISLKRLADHVPWTRSWKSLLLT